jgi:hypothetical protein
MSLSRVGVGVTPSEEPDMTGEQHVSVFWSGERGKYVAVLYAFGDSPTEALAELRALAQSKALTEPPRAHPGGFDWPV